MASLMHDPSEYIRGLQQILISDKKKIAFLFGAGTSLAKKSADSINVPAIGELTKIIELELSKTDKYKKALSEIRMEIGENKYQIETLLSNLEQKKIAIGKGKLNNLDFESINELIIEIKKLIRDNISVHKKILLQKEQLDKLIHCDFSEWIGRADRKYPIEIFTTNYDYLFEIGLEYKCVPFYDGFTGSFLPFFNSDSVEDPYFLPRQTKLWKIHGSLGWKFDEANRKVIRNVSDSEDILIYPSTVKYSDSKKQPYVSLLDRLSSFLKQDDSILITCGYSFSDEHINERIRTALNTSSCSHVLALYYDTLIDKDGKKINTFQENSHLANIAKSNSKLSIYAGRSALIGCQYGKWKLRREPEKDDMININLYFENDTAIGCSEIGKNFKGNEVWTGEGEFILPDFVKFVAFLNSMIIDNQHSIQFSK